jgi:ComF family protein
MRVQIVHALLKPVLDYAVPKRCHGCGEILSSGGDFCGGCWANIKFIAPPWCSACALPLPFDNAENNLCAACIRKRPRHDGIFAAVAYDDLSARIALKLKYGGKIGVADLIANQLQRHLMVEDNEAILVPVPLHWTRLWQRGYNQSVLIARSLAAPRNLVVLPDALQRIKKTPPLKGMSAVMRSRTVANAFKVNPRIESKIRGANIILIDDVYTSGATADACVKQLKSAGARSVKIFCWARVLPGALESSLTDISLP